MALGYHFKATLRKLMIATSDLNRKLKKVNQVRRLVELVKPLITIVKF